MGNKPSYEKEEPRFHSVEDALVHLKEGSDLTMEDVVDIYKFLYEKVVGEMTSCNQNKMILVSTLEFFVKNHKEFPHEETKASVVLNHIRYQGHYANSPTFIGWWVVPGWNKTVFNNYQKVINTHPLFQKVVESKESSLKEEMTYSTLEEYARRRVLLHELFEVPTIRGFDGDN
jgi:hypothetical protein